MTARSLAEARTLGESTYFTGKPCPRGHLADRFTKWQTCVECCRLKSAARYRRDPAYFAEKNRAWHRAHRDEHREKAKRFMGGLEPGERSMRRKRYYESWKQADPVRAANALREHSALRRAREVGAEGSVSRAEWEELKDQFGRRCLSCGRTENETLLTLDHVVPLSRGGSNTIENAQPLCRPCNSSKGVTALDYRRKEPLVHHLV